jgi:hypothetical protein
VPLSTLLSRYAGGDILDERRGTAGCLGTIDIIIGKIVFNIAIPVQTDLTDTGSRCQRRRSGRRVNRDIKTRVLFEPIRRSGINLINLKQVIRMADITGRKVVRLKGYAPCTGPAVVFDIECRILVKYVAGIIETQVQDIA